MIAAKLLGAVAGAQLVLALSTAAFPTATPAAVTPQQQLTVVAVKFGLFVLFAILGSGAWAFSRPPGLKPYFADGEKHLTLRKVFTGFAWGMFALVVGLSMEWSQFKITAAVFLSALGWEFLMLTVVWLGKRLSSNPLQFLQDMRAGREARLTTPPPVPDEEGLSDTQKLLRKTHDEGGGLH